jgi:hemerythrin-like domain-containing protein
MTTPSSLKIIRDEHSTLAAMLKSTRMLVERGPQDDPRGFFDVLRAMLFYIEEFPERLHHPKETDLLFPRVAAAAPETVAAITRLDHDHEYTEKAVRDLLHLLVAWEMMGESRREAFTQTFKRYVDLYLAHMRMEEEEVLPAAVKYLTPEDWQALDAAFEANRDTMTKAQSPDQAYDELFSRIVRAAPAPIGLG